MFSQTSLTNRRQFLERSMLGFGSAFLLPSLLASCTDHIVPDPDPSTPIIRPPLSDVNIDWYDDTRTIVITALSEIPIAGQLIGTFTNIFWPDDTWSKVREQVEDVVNQKITDAIYKLVSDELGSSSGLEATGLIGTITLYTNEVNSYNESVIAYANDPTKPLPDPKDLRTQWIATRTVFVAALGQFKSAGYELPLLGLFAQFANMYLSLIRDMVVHGKDWGRSDTDQTQDGKDLIAAITSFKSYVTDTYNTGRNNIIKGFNGGPANDPTGFNVINAYDRQMAFLVLDFRDTWDYFDATQYPTGTGTQILLTREIYSDYSGDFSTDAAFINLPSPPTQFPTQLTVWGGSRIDAVQLTYPAGGGPGGGTQTPRMGDQNGGTNQSPHGGILNISPDNLIIQARAVNGDVLQALQFYYNNGTLTDKFGGSGGNHDSGLIGYNYEALSSVYINGVSHSYGSASGVIFGFQYWQPPTATLRALGALYVASPKEQSAADLAQAFPKLGISANSITDELKAARQAYWAAVKARAKKLK